MVDISLKSQIQLLNYLYTKSKEEIDQFKSMLDKNQDIKYDILESFLGLSENHNLANNIVNISKSKISSDTKKCIFQKYNDILSYIESSSKEQSKELELDKSELYSQSISKLNNFLK
jgi:hypothetical protein